MNVKNWMILMTVVGLIGCGDSFSATGDPGDGGNDGGGDTGGGETGGNDGGAGEGGNNTGGQGGDGGETPCEPGTSESCGIDTGECEKGTRHCDDEGSWGPCEGEVKPAPEWCDGKDNNCTGGTDEGSTCDASIEIPAEADGVRKAWMLDDQFTPVNSGASSPQNDPSCTAGSGALQGTVGVDYSYVVWDSRPDGDPSDGEFIWKGYNLKTLTVSWKGSDDDVPPQCPTLPSIAGSLDSLTQIVPNEAPCPAPDDQDPGCKVYSVSLTGFDAYIIVIEVDSLLP